MPISGRLFYPLSRKNVIAPLAKEGGNAIGVDGGIEARATKQSPRNVSPKCLRIWSLLVVTSSISLQTTFVYA